MHTVLIVLTIIGILTVAALTAVAVIMAADLIKQLLSDIKINKIWRKRK